MPYWFNTGGWLATYSIKSLCSAIDNPIKLKSTIVIPFVLYTDCFNHRLKYVVCLADKTRDINSHNDKYMCVLEPPLSPGEFTFFHIIFWTHAAVEFAGAPFFFLRLLPKL